MQSACPRRKGLHLVLPATLAAETKAWLEKPGVKVWDRGWGRFRVRIRVRVKCVFTICSPWGSNLAMVDYNVELGLGLGLGELGLGLGLG